MDMEDERNNKEVLRTVSKWQKGAGDAGDIYPSAKEKLIEQEIQPAIAQYGMLQARNTHSVQDASVY